MYRTHIHFWYDKYHVYWVNISYKYAPNAVCSTNWNSGKRSGKTFSDLNSTKNLIFMCVLFSICVILLLSAWNCSFAKEDVEIFAIGSIFDMFEPLFFVHCACKCVRKTRSMCVEYTHIWLCHILKSQSKCVTQRCFIRRSSERG